MNVVSGTSRADLRDLLHVWTGAAARMTAGHLVGEETEADAPPVDTGEAVGSPVSRLTITVGYGPSLFDDRFGLAGRKPSALADLPPLPNENLDPDYTGGDLCIQACADNPLQPRIRAAQLVLAEAARTAGWIMLMVVVIWTLTFQSSSGPWLDIAIAVLFLQGAAGAVRVRLAWHRGQRLRARAARVTSSGRTG